MYDVGSMGQHKGEILLQSKQHNRAIYSTSFAVAGLCRSQSVRLASLYLQMQRWELVRDRVQTDNLLQMRTQSSSQRICQELVNRLQTLSQTEIEFLVHAQVSDQGYLLWIALCRSNQFVSSFAIQILRDRFLASRESLSREDFDEFFNRLCDSDEAVNSIKSATRQKIRQALFRILCEAGLITSDHEIRTAVLSPEFWFALDKQQNLTVQVLPVFESNFKGNAEWDDVWFRTHCTIDLNTYLG
jgi:hypothetical protein